jgi:uncharacterized Zn-finger protein
MRYDVSYHIHISGTVGGGTETVNKSSAEIACQAVLEKYKHAKPTVVQIVSYNKYGQEKAGFACRYCNK